MRIAVAGATGRVGRHVAEVAEERGHEVVRMSRGTRVDVITGDGLAAALHDVDVIVDVATGPSPDQDEATRFFTTSARNLHEYGEQAGVRRLIVVSIVGIDNYAGGYGAAKLVHEQTALAGSVPTAIIRATQFHEFVEQMMAWGNKDGVVYVPRMRTQPIAARAVAESLVDEVENPSDGMVNVAGPQEEDLGDLVAQYAAYKGETVRVESQNDPGDPDAALNEAGALLPPADARILGPTFKAWLDGAVDN